MAGGVSVGAVRECDMGGRFRIDLIADDEPSPLDRMIEAEATDTRPKYTRNHERKPTVLVEGCMAWPVPGQSREPYGPDSGVNPRGGKPYSGPCAACGSEPARGHYCLCCDRPRGVNVKLTLPQIVKRVLAQDRLADGLAGGTGKVAVKLGA